MNRTTSAVPIVSVAMAGVLLALSACSSSSNTTNPSNSQPSASASANTSAPAGSAAAFGGMAEGPFEGWVEGLPKIEAPAGFDWKQFSGTQLNFISENTPPSSALAANIGIFEKATGIQVNIEQSNLDIVAEKVGLDFNARNANYQLIYADPYQILSKQSKNLADLNDFNNDPSLPHIPGGLEDFIESQLQADGYMGDTEHLYALPYDSPTMVLAYRKDVFDKYKDQFQQEKGYDWTPSANMTWDQYYEISSWINDKVKSGAISEVKYGSGHEAKQHDSLQADFSNVLGAYGADYFEGENLGSVGAARPGKSLLTSPEAVEAATMYKKLLDIAAPGSKTWDWTGVAEAFAAGDLAMAPIFHENNAMFEDANKSKVVGKVAWSILPKGTKRSANLFGGTGIGISKYASEKEQKAAWLFLVWATSPQAQYMILKSEEAGSTPTRHSVYNLPDVKKGMEPGTEEAKAMPNLLPMNAVLEAWKLENVYMRPKVPQWPQVDTIIYTELSKMLFDKQTPEETMKAIAKKSDDITGN
ncbi:extracellular solute-binding protein [Cohnella xylanilytica]|uniref:Extracellular solute-binding protein n=1 Tax=Cohnella xylanilytica TaxID=557555 RepID=A0A841TT56_9BACL|nr:extracellular solute-binding protein [Cohnella xylanilytica]MBB6690278.1 extracellular solute-binding protein [Cohnella xylanilytica]